MSRSGVLVALGLAACGSTTVGSTASASIAHWKVLAHVRSPDDVVASPAGSLVVAGDGRLLRLSAGGAVKPFPSAYRSTGGEPYIALAHGGCFGAGTVYALKLSRPQGVFAIAPHKAVRVLATLAAPGLANGIAFDTTGRFGYRLLVTVSGGGRTTVYAITCGGHVSTVTTSAPTVEGGMVVAPAGFGRFGGDLIAPDELSGKIYAITPTGRPRLLAVSDLPRGQDIGVESLGFLPPGSGPYEVFTSDRVTAGSLHPGDNVTLELGSAALRSAGAAGGDLLAGTEGGALVDAVACGPEHCSVRKVAAGPKIAHGEGHIAVLGG